MRILHVTDVYLPRLGGIEMQVHDLADHQRRRGHDVTVLTTTADDGAAEDPATVRLPGSRPRVLRRVLAEAAPDVVHCHSSGFSPLAWMTARQALVAGLPVVATMHSVVPALGPVADLIRRVVRQVGPGMSWTSVSTVGADSLTRLVPTPVGVSPNGVDASGWTTADPGVADVPTIVAVMRLTTRKRPVPLLAILAAVRDLAPDTPFRAVIAGAGPRQAAAEHALVKYGLTDQVQLAGRLSRPQVAQLLAGADLFLAPAYLESFGIAALEARCAGLPVIAMRGGGVQEFIRDGEDGFLVGDDTQMAARTAELLTDRTLLRGMAQQIRTTPTNLGWEETVDRAVADYVAAGAVDRRGALTAVRS